MCGYSIVNEYAGTRTKNRPWTQTNWQPETNQLISKAIVSHLSSHSGLQR